MAFGGVTYTITDMKSKTTAQYSGVFAVDIADMEAKTSFGWIGLYATLDGKGVNGNGFNDGSATWFSYDEEKWGHSESDDKVKEMWKGCSRTCPLSFFSALLGLLLSGAFLTLLWEEQIGGDSAKLAQRKDLWAKWVPFWITLCMLCGVTIVLAFGLGCYRNVTAEGAGVPEDMFEANMGGGFIVAIIATCLSIVMTVLVFMHRADKLAVLKAPANRPNNFPMKSIGHGGLGDESRAPYRPNKFPMQSIGHGGLGDESLAPTEP